MSGAPLTVTGALRALKAEMDYDGADVSMRDLRLLLAHAMGVEPVRLTLLAQDPVAPGVFDAARRLCIRRSIGTPVSHLRGYRDFFGRRFAVDGRVLDPRPETETLIALALQQPFASVLDLGTGSGCILITLLAERPDATGIGVDLSPEALQVAERNAETLGVLPRAAFIAGTWLDTVGGQYDLIVSNPPYIAADEMRDLSLEVQREPRMALTDEGDGLSADRIIARDAPAHLAPGGRLLVEIGATQSRAVTEIFSAAGLEQVAMHPDISGKPRVIAAHAP